MYPSVRMLFSSTPCFFSASMTRFTCSVFFFWAASGFWSLFVIPRDSSARSGTRRTVPVAVTVTSLAAAAAFPSVPSDTPVSDAAVVSVSALVSVALPVSAAAVVSAAEAEDEAPQAAAMRDNKMAAAAVLKVLLILTCFIVVTSLFPNGILRKTEKLPEGHIKDCIPDSACIPAQDPRKLLIHTSTSRTVIMIRTTLLNFSNLHMRNRPTGPMKSSIRITNQVLA